MNKRFIYSIVAISILLILIKGGLILFNPVPLIAPQLQKNQTEKTYLRSMFISRDYFDQAYDRSQQAISPPSGEVVAGIIPHHLFVKEHLASWFDNLDDDYETVIIIGPNHFNRGTSNFITASLDWSTPYGILNIDQELLAKIKNSLEITIDNQTMQNEHSITGLVPFIKKSLPQAILIPIIVKEKIAFQDLDLLVEVLQKIKQQKKILMIASVDFSHEQNLAISNEQDKESAQIISNYDYENLLIAKLDSPSSIYTIMKYSQNIEAQPYFVGHTNTSKLLGQPEAPGTSHLFFYFY